MPPHEWNADHYLKFADARTLPAIDLLSRISLPATRCVVDLGCGPGNSTTPLRARWPDAKVIAISGGGHYGRSGDFLGWASELGADEVLAKPFRVSSLITAARLVLERAPRI